MKRFLILSIFLFIITASSYAEEIAAEYQTAWGGATAKITDEYKYGDQPALKMEFAEKDGGVWFKTTHRDWTKYRELVFTLYNPWNDDKRRSISLRDGTSGKKAIRLPGSATIPDGGSLRVPRETRVTFRLDLDNKELAEAVDLENITGIHIGKGNEDTTFYLDGFTLRTQEEVKNSAHEELTGKVKTIESRLANVHIPQAYQKRVNELRASLQTALEGDPESDTAEKTLNQAAEMATVLERVHKDEKRKLETVFVTSMQKVFRDEPLPVVEEHLIEAAGNERVSFQTVIVPFQPLEQVQIKASDLIREGDESIAISASAVHIDTVGYVEVPHSFYYKSSRTGWWPDPLLRSKPIDVNARIQPFWITVHVPSDQAAGIYTGKLQITAAGGVESTMEYRLQVWDFSLPVRGELQTLISFTYKPKEQATRRAVYSTLLDYRLSPVNIYINASVQFGYQPERSDLEFCLERGLNTLVLWNPYNKEAEFPYDFDDKYVQRMTDFIADYEPELRKLGAWDMSMVLGFDEITHKEKAFVERATRGAERILKAMRENFPDLPMANIGGPPLPSLLQGPGNIWIPGTRILSEEWKDELNRIRNQEGSKYFLYWVYGDPSFMLDLPGIAPRWLSWMAFKYEAKGIAYYSAIRGESFADAPEEVDWNRNRYNVEKTKRYGRNGDGSLVYPARDETILPSIRLANTRDGIQDYEYFARLRDLVKEKPDEEAVELLNLSDAFLTQEHYAKDPKILLEYRRRVARTIERLQSK